jgi:RNA polymerase sigma-70 factor (ECF subfamily)
MSAQHDQDPAHELSALLAGEGESLQRLARSLSADAASAEDLLQEGALAALRRGGAGIARPGAWLSGTLKNLAARHWRDRERRQRREQSHAHSERLPSTADLLAEREVLANLMQAVRELDDIYARPLLLLYFHDMSAEEAARALGVPAATVRTRHRRGLEKLREKLDRSHDTRDSWCAVLLAFSTAGRDHAGEASVTVSPWILVAGCAALVGLVWIGWSHGANAEDATSGVEPAFPPSNAVAGVEPVTAEFGMQRAPIAVVDESAESLAGRDASVAAAPSDPPGALVVRGVVRDAFGQPVPYAQVRRGEMLDLFGSRARAQCDADGAYRFVLQPDEEIEFRAWKPGWISSDVIRLPITAVLSNGLDFVLPGLAQRLEGRVVDAHGAPVPLAWVRVGPELGNALDPSDPYGSRAPSGPLARTDAEGRYQLDGVPVGPALLVAHEAGLGYARRRVVVEPGLVTTLDVPLEPFARIRGRVLDEQQLPIRDALLRPESCGPRTAYTLRSDADGRFDLPCPGIPSLYVIAQKGASLQSQRFALVPGEVREWNPVLPRSALAPEPDGSSRKRIAIALVDASGDWVAPRALCLSAGVDRRAGPSTHVVRALHGVDRGGWWMLDDVAPGHYGVWAGVPELGLFLAGEIDVAPATLCDQHEYQLVVPPGGWLHANIVVPEARIGEPWKYVLDPLLLGQDLLRGLNHGPIPQAIGLAVGHHVLRLESASGERREIEFEIRANATTVLDLDLP